jgi:hypothetical protein
MQPTRSCSFILPQRCQPSKALIQPFYRRTANNTSFASLLDQETDSVHLMGFLQNTDISVPTHSLSAERHSYVASVGYCFRSAITSSYTLVPLKRSDIVVCQSEVLRYVYNFFSIVEDNLLIFSAGVKLCTVFGWHGEAPGYRGRGSGESNIVLGCIVRA